MIQVLDHVLLHRLEVVHDVRQLGILLAQFIDQVAHGKHRYLAVQFLHLLPGLAFPMPHLDHGLLKLLLEGGYILLESFALLLRQFLKLVGADDLAFAQGGEGQSGRRADQRDALFLRPLLHLAESPLLSFLEFFLGFLPARAVILALEGGRDCSQQFLHQPLHIAAQTDCLTRREPQGARSVRLIEVVDVAPVRGDWLGGGLPIEELTDGGAFPRATGPQSEQVVTLSLDANAKMDRIHRPLLADNLAQAFQVGGRLEVKLRWITARTELLCRQRSYHCVRVSLARCLMLLIPGSACSKPLGFGIQYPVTTPARRR